ncbi:TPA: hypothetical protein ACH6AG_000102 [Campylobacter jejuni]
MANVESLLKRANRTFESVKVELEEKIKTPDFAKCVSEKLNNLGLTSTDYDISTLDYKVEGDSAEVSVVALGSLPKLMNGCFRFSVKNSNEGYDITSVVYSGLGQDDKTYNIPLV